MITTCRKSFYEEQHCTTLKLLFLASYSIYMWFWMILRSCDGALCQYSVFVVSEVLSRVQKLSFSGWFFSFGSQEEVAKNLLAEFNLGCDAHRTEHVYRVYVSTFLGFGGNAARQRYEKSLIINTSTQNRWSSVLLDVIFFLFSFQLL